MSTDSPKWKRHLTKVLTLLLIFMVCLSILQWFIIEALLDFGTEMLKEVMVRQAPAGVNRDDIINTFERVKGRAQQLPFSFIAGKISLRKIKAAGEYAIEASADENWEAKEIKSLLILLDASVGYKREKLGD